MVDAKKSKEQDVESKKEKNGEKGRKVTKV